MPQLNKEKIKVFGKNLLNGLITLGAAFALGFAFAKGASIAVIEEQAILQHTETGEKVLVVPFSAPVKLIKTKRDES